LLKKGKTKEKSMKEEKSDRVDFVLESGEKGCIVDLSKSYGTQIRVYVGDKWAEWGTVLFEFEHYSEFNEGEDEEVFRTLEKLGYRLPSKSEVEALNIEARKRRERCIRANDFREAGSVLIC
jgi:hypothetical protein